MTPYIVKRNEGFDVHSTDALTIFCVANNLIEITKEYGPLSDSTGVRVILEYTADKADWVVYAFDSNKGGWVEKIRWDCQENTLNEELN